uniref:mannose-P-dolichol utilization defect 1 protein n=1 Tax=Lonchura striata TaxID=40157 RepID=UPI000B4CAAE2|nr:mannose-P-dolichol utilization defect 1 protein [Lonchura striata domestica]
MEPLRPWLVPFLLPEHCFDQFFLRLQLLHVPCLKILLSKVLGYGIVAGSVLVKVPQLLKVWGSRSGGGLSLPSVLLELLALGGSVGYGCARSFPFRFGLIQIVTNARQGHTGQLSGVSTGLLFGGALARIFTSLTETGDLLLASTFAASAACNGVLLAQVLLLGGSRDPHPKKE